MNPKLSPFYEHVGLFLLLLALAVAGFTYLPRATESISAHLEKAARAGESR